MKAIGLVSQLGAIALSACATVPPQPIPVEFEGIFAHGFEVSSFSPCGRDETWWAVISRAGLSRYQELAAPYQPVYMKVLGDTTPRTNGGHLGLYNRYLNVHAVLEVRPLVSEQCGTSSLYR